MEKFLTESGFMNQIQNQQEDFHMEENFYEITSEYLADYLNTHICSTCGETIKKGGTYQQSKGTYNGSWTEYKICITCLENKPEPIMECMYLEPDEDGDDYPFFMEE